MRPSVRNHLIYNWWKYVAVVLSVVAFWVYLFGVLAKPQANQKINITYVGNDLKNKLLKEDILGRLEDLQGGQNIKEVGVECLYSDDSYALNTILTTRTSTDTDFVILKSSTLENFEVESYFVCLDPQKVDRYFKGAKTYEIDGKVYGIKLSGNNVFSGYYTGNEDCYAFITGVSVNFGSINGKGKTEDAVCINLINYLLEVNE